MSRHDRITEILREMTAPRPRPHEPLEQDSLEFTEILRIMTAREQAAKRPRPQEDLELPKFYKKSTPPPIFENLPELKIIGTYPRIVLPAVSL